MTLAVLSTPPSKERGSGVPQKKDNALLIQELRALRGRLIESDILGMSTDRDEFQAMDVQCRYQAIVEDQAELIAATTAGCAQPTRQSRLLPLPRP
jgi:hypothetical protein